MVSGTIVARIGADFLNAVRTFAWNDDIFTFASKSGDLFLDLFAFPPANFAQTLLATAVGTASVMTAGKQRTARGQENPEQKQQPLHMDVLIAPESFLAYRRTKCERFISLLPFGKFDDR